MDRTRARVEVFRRLPRGVHLTLVMHLDQDHTPMTTLGILEGTAALRVSGIYQGMTDVTLAEPKVHLRCRARNGTWIDRYLCLNDVVGVEDGRRVA